MVIQPLLTPSPRPQRVTFAWQGWQLSVPAGWNPLTLSGSFSSGHVLLADLDQPRLGLRWKTVVAKRVTREFLEHVVREEVGAPPSVPASHARGDGAGGADAPAAVCHDPEAPGRDAYATWAAGSQRVIELVYHRNERDDVLMSEIVPSLRETIALPWQPWAILDLACTVPAGFELRSHDLRAGDLQLNWACGNRFVSVRQIALADVALKRTTLEHLVRDRQRQQHLQYRSDQAISNVTLTARDGRQLDGRAGSACRRRRFFWRRGLSARRATLALHDRARNRIVTVEADDASLARDVALTVGHDCV